MDAIEKNKLYVKLLGWAPSDFGVTAFDATLIEAVRAAQVRLGVGVDGICGPMTYGAWLKDEQAKLIARQAQAGAERSSEDAGRIALYEAKRTWLLSIVDPPSVTPEYHTARTTIDAMIRSNQGLLWDWESPYSKDGDFEWCGAFAAYAWRGAGMKLALRKHFFSSNYRLNRWARYLPFEVANPKPPAGPYRKWLELDESSGPLEPFFGPGDGPRPGDILLVGGVKTDYGKHITIVESYDASTGTFTTIEGNGTGALPSGRAVQGVIRTRRTVGLPSGAATTTYHARRLIRPSLVDLA